MRFAHMRGSSLVALLVAAAPAFGQVSQTTGAIRGVVSSKAGAWLEGATVTLRSLETGATRTVKTDPLGYYVFPFLPIGPYEVTVTMSGFKTAKDSRSHVSLGQTTNTHFDLDVAQAEATVEVVSEATQVDAERVSAATLLSTDLLTTLPVAGRRWESSAFLTPMVTSSSRGDLAIGGQRGVNTTTMVDGAGFNSTFFGGTLGKEANGTPYTMSSEAIREFQVITDGASAEFGRMGGGYLNAVTNSGTNQFKGSLFYFDRPRNMVARQHSNGQEVAEFKTRQFGVSLGGPLVKDKLFFYVVLDNQRDSRPNDMVFGLSPTTPLALNPLNPADAVLISKLGNYTTKNDADTVFVRFDWNLAPNHALQLRLNRSKFTGDNSAGFNRAYEATSLEEGKTTSWVAQWNWTISQNWFNEFKINALKEELPRTARTQIAQVAIGSYGTYGQNAFNRAFEAKVTQYSDILTYVNNAWQVRAGMDYNAHSIFETFTPRAAGVYTFQDSTGPTQTAYQNFQNGLWNNYQQFFSLIPGVSAAEAGTMNEKEKEYAAFLQADYRLSSVWKFGFGLRYDKQEHPAFGIADFVAAPAAYTRPGPLTAHVPSDSSISPRLSFTYTPDADGSTVARGSLGRYVSRTPAVFLYQVLTSNGTRAANVRFNTTVAAYPLFTRGATFNWATPFQFAAYDPVNFPGVTPDIQTFSPDFKNPRTDRFNLGIEHAYKNGVVLGLSGAYARTQNLERIAELNLPGTVTTNAQGRQIYTGARPNANYRSMQVYVSDADGRYQALTFSLKYQKEGSPIQAGIFYTFSQERDNDSNERSFSGYGTQDPNDLMGDYSWSANDRRNVITGYLTVHEKWLTGILFAANLRYLGGAPYNPTFGSDLNGDGNANERPLGTVRNAFREPGRFTVDLKMSRDFKFSAKVNLNISAEIYNLFNQTVRYARYRLTGNDASYTYTPVTATASTERSVQLGARLSF